LTGVDVSVDETVRHDDCWMNHRATSAATFPHRSLECCHHVHLVDSTHQDNTTTYASSSALLFYVLCLPQLLPFSTFTLTACFSIVTPDVVTTARTTDNKSRAHGFKLQPFCCH